MDYTVKMLAKLAGVSARTLRYYDSIGLLKPARINDSGYRIYGSREIERLQQILFYRELGMELKGIQEILDAPEFDTRQALESHYQQLLEKQEQIEQLIRTVRKSLADLKGECRMTDNERFQGFKKEMIEENERLYGEEIRQKYGEESVAKAYQGLKGMTLADKDYIEDLTARLNARLKKLASSKDIAGEDGRKVYELHKSWLSFYWRDYSACAHREIVRMYTEDERFKAYYEKISTGGADLIRDAVLYHSPDRGSNEA